MQGYLRNLKLKLNEDCILANLDLRLFKNLSINKKRQRVVKGIAFIYLNLSSFNHLCTIIRCLSFFLCRVSSILDHLFTYHLLNNLSLKYIWTKYDYV